MRVRVATVMTMPWTLVTRMRRMRRRVVIMLFGILRVAMENFTGFGSGIDVNDRG
jgi:hypothetical protein